MPPDAPLPTVLDYARPPRRWGWGAWLNAAAFGLAPFAVAVIYVVFSRWPGRIFTERSDFLAEGIACGAGAFFAARLPLPEWARWGLLLACAAAFYWFADGIMLYLVGTIHGDWL